MDTGKCDIEEIDDLKSECTNNDSQQNLESVNYQNENNFIEETVSSKYQKHVKEYKDTFNCLIGSEIILDQMEAKSEINNILYKLDGKTRMSLLLNIIESEKKENKLIKCRICGNIKKIRQFCCRKNEQICNYCGKSFTKIKNHKCKVLLKTVTL